MSGNTEEKVAEGERSADTKTITSLTAEEEEAERRAGILKQKRAEIQRMRKQSKPFNPILIAVEDDQNKDETHPMR